MMASVLLITCMFFLQTKSEENDYDVVIVGAGMSGIAAAAALVDAGITDILILEAQDYIGGRTGVVDFAGYSFNSGASWISGACVGVQNKAQCGVDGNIPSATNPMLDLANKYGIEFMVQDWDSLVSLDFGGSDHDYMDSNTAWDDYGSAAACVQNIVVNITQGKMDDMSYSAALYLCGWQQPFTDIQKSVGWSSYEFGMAQHARFTSADGSGGSTFTEFGSQSLFITDARGYQGITLGLAAEFLDLTDLENEAKIQLNSPVATVSYNQTGVSVTLDDGAQYTADYAIVTCSLGVLQSSIINFEPELPSWKRDALMAFGMGRFVPVYIKWPYDFWSATTGNVVWFQLNDDRYGFFNWVMNLDHNSLFGGSLVWRIDTTMDLADLIADQSLNDTVSLLVDLKLKHYFADVPQPDEIFVSAWPSNPYVQGSYSVWSMGADDEKLEAMRWPLVQRLFFGGEGMEEESGFVHSAYWRGTDVANQILGCMHRDDVGETDGFECPEIYEMRMKGNVTSLPMTTSDKSFSDTGDCGERGRGLNAAEWVLIVLGFVLIFVIGFASGYYCFIRRNGRQKIKDQTLVELQQQEDLVELHA